MTHEEYMQREEDKYRALVEPYNRQQREYNTSIAFGNRIRVLMKYNMKCAYCGCDIQPETFNIDHIIPKCNGGKHIMENYNPACRSCNSSKGKKSVEDFKYFLWRKKYNIPWFNNEQLQYLTAKGIDLLNMLDIPKLQDFKFYYETYSPKSPAETPDTQPY